MNQTLGKPIPINHVKAFSFTASSGGKFGKPKKRFKPILYIGIFVIVATKLL